MVYVTAALVLVGVVAGLNLVLTFGVIRRLRQHSELLAARGLRPTPQPPSPGDPVGGFRTTTVDGETVTRDTLPAGSLVVFFSPGCPPCEEHLPGLVARLRESDRPRAETLAVVLGEAGESAHMVEQLTPVALVVRETAPSTLLQTAFGVWSAPIALVVDGSTIREVFTDVGEAAVLAAA